MAKITCIIIEDEKPAQEILKSFIAKTEWLQLIAVFNDAIEALEFFKKNDVDFIFLDLQMPGVSGLDFLKILKSSPQVIITTAYAEHALEAFDLDVRDYLLKPFSFDRFIKAVNRITPKPDMTKVHQLKSVMTEKSFAFFNVNKIMVKVMFDDILYIESMREYVYIHQAEEKVVTKIGIGEIEKLLTPNFLRIHRSYLINSDKVTAYSAEEIYIGKVQLPIGLNYKKLVENFLKASRC
jgi:two-component system, LytTR family, response regulator